jgi:competence protein ComEC
MGSKDSPIKGLKMATPMIAAIGRTAWVMLVFLGVVREAAAELPAFGKPGPLEMRAHYINVGQGSSVLLEFSCAAALIDTGGEKNSQFDSVSALQDYLDRFFARRSDLKQTIDLLLITHAHIDHTRGLPMVLGKYTIRSYVDNGAETGSGGRQQKAAHTRVHDSSAAKISWQAITEPEVNVTSGLTSKTISPISCPGISPQFHVLWGALRASDGWPKAVFDNQNDSSVVSRLDFGKASFLFPGDLEDDVHEKLIDFFCGGTPPKSVCAVNADVYHVAHHGSYNGTSAALLKAVTPKIAVISMGPSNRDALWTAVAYGHPRNAAVDLLMAPATGVTATRPPTSVLVATRAGAKGKAAAGEFVPYALTGAIYGTGWDGTVVVTAKSDGTLHVDSEGLHP